MSATSHPISYQSEVISISPTTVFAGIFSPGVTPMAKEKIKSFIKTSPPQNLILAYIHRLFFLCHFPPKKVIKNDI